MELIETYQSLRPRCNLCKNTIIACNKKMYLHWRETEDWSMRGDYREIGVFLPYCGYYRCSVDSPYLIHNLRKAARVFGLQVPISGFYKIQVEVALDEEEPIYDRIYITDRLYLEKVDGKERNVKEANKIATHLKKCIHKVLSTLRTKKPHKLKFVNALIIRYNYNPTNSIDKIK